MNSPASAALWSGERSAIVWGDGAWWRARRSSRRCSCWFSSKSKVPCSIPVLIGLGLTALSVSPVFLALVQDQLPDNRATANGLFMLYAFGIRALNVLMVGALGDALGLQSAFIAAALISLLSLAIDNHPARDTRSTRRSLVA